VNRATGTDDPVAVFVGQGMVEADATFVFCTDWICRLVVDFLRDHF